MMPDRRPVMVVCVHLLRARLLTTGAWCDRCLLPSIITVELLLLFDHRHTRYATLTCCTDCGEVIR